MRTFWQFLSETNWNVELNTNPIPIPQQGLMYELDQTVLDQLDNDSKIEFALYCVNDIKNIWKDIPEAVKCVELTEKWLDDKSVTASELHAAYNAAYTAAYANTNTYGYAAT